MALFSGQDQEVTITVTAKDDATSVLKKIQGQLGETVRHNDSMAASVFKGVAAWDIAKRSIQVATDFLRGAVAESMEAERVMAQVRQNVENAGIAFESVAPKIGEYSAAMLKLGFDDEEAAESIGKLINVTGDYAQAAKLGALAADLARAKNVGLADATRIVTLAAQGNTRELKLMGIELDESADASDNLAKLQDKLAGSAVAFANTAAGQLEIVTQQWANMKQEIGDRLMPTLSDLFVVAEHNMPAIESMVLGIAKALEIAAKGAIMFTKGFTGIGKIGAMAISEAASKGSKFAAINSALLEKIGLTSKEQTKAISDYGKTWDDTTKVLVEDLYAVADGSSDAYSQADAARDAWAKVQSQAAKSFAGIGAATKESNKAAKDAEKEVEKLTDRYGDLTEAMTKVAQTATDELASLKESHRQNVDSARASIDNLRKSLKDLTSDYKKSAADAAAAFSAQEASDRAGAAAAIVKQEEKIAELRKQAGMETDPKKRAALIRQFREEEAAYSANSEFIMSLDAEVIEARRRASLTDFERELEDYQARLEQAVAEYESRRAEAAAEYDARKKEIKDQLKQEQERLDEENKKYKAAKAQMKAILADAEKSRLDVTRATSEEILKVVDREIDRYNKLADAIQRAAQGRPSQVSSRVSREFGGIVPGPVGMPVPIIAHGQEKIIPASRSGEGGAHFSIVINNPSVRSDADLNAMRRVIEDALRDVSRGHKLTTI